MKILVVSQYFWPEQFLINELVDSLSSDGHDIEVLTAEPNYPSGKIYKEYINNESKYSQFGDIKVHRCKIIPRGNSKIGLIGNYFSFMLSSTYYVKKNFRESHFDIILFFQLSPVFSGLPAIVCKKQLGIPLATWVQDLWPESLTATGQVKNHFVIENIRKFVKYLYKNSDSIYIQSEWFRKKIESEVELKSFGKIKYLPNWSNKCFEESKIIEVDFYSKIDDVFDFVFAGNIGEAQDLDNIIKAASLVNLERKFRIVIIGDGKAKKRAEILASDMNLSDKVKFISKKDIKYMPAVFNKADALLVSLRDEAIFNMTIPSKVQAYLASGKPILASLSGAGAEIISESHCGIISPPGDSKALSIAMQQMMNLTDDERTQMSLNGKEYYKSNFSFSHVKEALVADLKRLSK
ncbi:glycosyltransferase family 4 protein [Vibrio nigripulchritudo]|uniref:glycosyltransferase family 4 protein n=2 Tax=Vibrio nigripulchritudo TaxID=28173 RepID=UPI00066C9EEA|nr:glycosyltransferase family 4 protein [Vibrio nigripulchritudo]